jgi:hypothetical protein
MKLNMIKWRLMLTTLPATLFMLCLKLGLFYGLHFEGLVKFSEIGIVVTGGIFLLGFMLAGVMTDYKESEKMPAELACAIETLDDIMTLAYEVKLNFDIQELRLKLRSVTESIIQYFERKHGEDVVFQKISSITELAQVMETANAGGIISRMSVEQHNLRKLFTRVTVIKRTNFLSTGYALLQVLSVIIFGLLLISKFDNIFVSGIIVCFITQIFVYMIRLIMDVDQPFEYSAIGIPRASDVDLTPLMEYYSRSASRQIHGERIA